MADVWRKDQTKPDMERKDCFPQPEQTQEVRKAHAPYNFVPLPENKILTALEKGKALPGHDKMDPQRRTGEIHITLTACTPVFVSDGNKNEPHFFRTAGKQYAIPGSTVRGMARENMQILSLSPLHLKDDFMDFQIYFRQFAGRNDDVSGDLKEYYREKLTIQPINKQRNTSVALDVKSGWIRCEQGKYYVFPTREPYLRVSRQRRDVQQFNTSFLELRDEKERSAAETRANNARVVEVFYTDDGQGNVKQIFKPTDPAVQEPEPRKKRGALLYTGKTVGKVLKNCIYLFPEPDDAAKTERMSDEDVLSYREDFENRRNNLNAYYNPSFWELPQEGQSKPVFYLKTDGHLYCGMTQFLRIGYKYPLSGGLPEYRVDLESLVDYPRAILGFVSQKESWRSRVSFSDCLKVTEHQEMEPIQMILASPKPSWYPGYVVPDGNRAVHYNQEGRVMANAGDEAAKAGFRLRGFKQYWLKEPVATSVVSDKKKVGTTIRPMPVGTKFTGTVRYQDLTAAELGLLLWSLRLGLEGLQEDKSEPCYQTIGMGKPYGYGRMLLTIDSLTEYTPDSLYGGDLMAPESQQLEDEACAEKVNAYIQAYDAEATDKLAGPGRRTQPLHKRASIQDFLWIRSQIRSGSDYNYMALDDYRAMNSPLPVLRDLRNAPQKADEQPAQQETMKPAAEEPADQNSIEANLGGWIKHKKRR